MDRRIAVVTGAAQGVAYLVAKQLSETHRVALVDVEGNDVGRAAGECGPDAVAVECNLIEQEEVEAAVEQIVGETGGIDVVVSAAGIGIGGALRHTHPDVVAAQMNINVVGNWRFIHACLPHVIERQGYVLGVASAAAIAPTPALGGYCASKAGIEMLLEVLRLEVAYLGVDVGIAYFLFHDTEMVRMGKRFIPAFERTLANQPGPMHKLYPAEKAADAVVKAVRGREHKAFSPGYLGELSATRMMLRTEVGSKQAKEQAHEIDELTLQAVNERGSFAGAVVPTLACKAAARSVGGGTSRSG
ncbi:MAG: SDR family NAD(P)-dependent oxidoreductase [Chloroflexota bacterium]